MKPAAALVTGGGLGIGQGIVLALAEAGYDIGIHCRTNRGGAEEAAARVRELGRAAVIVQADLRSVAQIRRMFVEMRAAFPAIDLMVNNAGVTRMVPFLETSEETFDELIETNLKGPYFCCQEAARWMVEQGVRGTIVNISSNNSVGCWPHASAYGAAKAGLNKMGRNLALELAPHGIRVVTLAPGYTKKGLADACGNDFEEQTTARIPLRRFCTAIEVGRVVAFLASASASYITGTEIFMDGGALLPVLPENDYV
jgi:glucose 1-dehydrogenase